MTAAHPTAGAADARRRWLALVVLCLGELMIVLDTTIVNVALPSIRTDLGFTETALVWVVNAYMLTFGGFMLLGGRLGDLYGHRRMFLAGLAIAKPTTSSPVSTTRVVAPSSWVSQKSFSARAIVTGGAQRASTSSEYWPPLSAWTAP